MDYTVGNYTSMDKIHVVNVYPGDTVYDYSKQSGSSQDEIIENNGLDSKGRIYSGDKVIVEFAKDKEFERIHYNDEFRMIFVYTVEKGDTITGIFDKYDLNISDLYIYNMLNPDFQRDEDLKVGQKLALPFPDADFIIREKDCPKYVNKYDYFSYLEEVRPIYKYHNGSQELVNEPSLDYTYAQNMHIMLQNKSKDYPSLGFNKLTDGRMDFMLTTNGYEKFYKEDGKSLNYDYICQLLGVDDLKIIHSQHNPSCKENHFGIDEEYRCNNQIIYFENAPDFVGKDY